MKLPGPDHPITIAPAAGAWSAHFDGQLIVRSARALVLTEATYPPVIYFPRQDADMAKLSRTSRSTNCPYKGDASYFSVGGGEGGQNAVWSYEAPYPAMAEIAGYLAFYPNKVAVSEG